MIILYHKYLFHVKWIIFSINCRKIFGYNKIMCTFAYTFCLAGKGWLDAKAELLGFKAVRQQKCQVRTHLHQKTLPQAESYFFYAIARAAIARALWQKNKIRNFGNVQNSWFSFFFCHCDPQQLILQTSASSVTDFGKFHRQLILSRNMSKQPNDHLIGFCTCHHSSGGTPRWSRCQAMDHSQGTSGRSSRYLPRTEGSAPNPVHSSAWTNRWHNACHVLSCRSRT